ncbi:2-phosphosulfolactate phosphatase [Kineococcus sp. DHX-1]|uniref:2-phosphosulfolactate phosphatase n=1 Tax=Kineococcus sp. DHX-1 TaxID=3349638 RepID=UPI0036D227B7
MTVSTGWGRDDLQRLGPDVTAVVVVDVLSFTTTVTVALDRGVEVVPHPWADATAADDARRRGAVLAVGRSRARAGEVSLSPVSVRAAGPGLRRIVLPSPNGATLTSVAAGLGLVVLAGSLRNADALAGRLARNPPSGPLLVLAAGEREAAGLRRAEEDLWGAGAVLSGLEDRGWVLSARARDAADAYRAVSDVRESLRDSVSGRELRDLGFAADVDVAAEVGVSDVVPVLVDGCFVAG